MKISTKGRYALRMMIDIAIHGEGSRVSIKEISRREDISEKYLEQIVPHLVRAGLLSSSRGPSGGYMLSRAADQYTAGEILRTIEGSLAPVACLDSSDISCQKFQDCPTLDFWKGLHNVIKEYVDATTLQDLVDIKKSKQSPDFSI